MSVKIEGNTELAPHLFPSIGHSPVEQPSTLDIALSAICLIPNVGSPSGTPSHTADPRNLNLL